MFIYVYICFNTYMFQHIAQLYYQDIDNGLKLLPKLTYEHINLSSYSIMRVNLAAQVLSSSVAKVLRAFGSPEAAATSKLCEMVDNFFDCLNVRSLAESEKKRKPFLAPYRSIDDERYIYFLILLNFRAFWMIFVFYKTKMTCFNEAKCE